MEPSLFKKFQLKEEFSVLMLNSKPNVHPLFDGFRLEYAGAGDHSYDSVVFYSKNEAEITEHPSEKDTNQKHVQQVWLSYSKTMENTSTKLRQPHNWDIAEGFGFEPTRSLSSKR